MSCTPAASARRASSGALRLASSQPSRILSVTGTLDGADHGLDQARGVIEVAHQGRARLLAGHLARRAAHVDVDDVGAQSLAPCARPSAIQRASQPASCMTKGARFAANCAVARAVALADQVLAGHHLGDDQAGAQAMRQAAERQVGDARHRRQQHVAAQRVPTDADWRRQSRSARQNLRSCPFIRQFPLLLCLGQTSAPLPASQVRNDGEARGSLRVVGCRSGRAKPMLGYAASRRAQALKTAALIVAAGRGTRAAGPLPKQYARIGGVPGAGPHARASSWSTRHRPGAGRDRRRAMPTSTTRPLHGLGMRRLLAAGRRRARRGRSPCATASRRSQRTRPTGC